MNEVPEDCKNHVMFDNTRIFLLDYDKKKLVKVPCNIAKDQKRIYLTDKNFNKYWILLCEKFISILCKRSGNYNISKDAMNEKVDLSLLIKPTRTAKIGNDYTIQYEGRQLDLDTQRLISKKAGALDDSRIRFVYALSDSFVHDKTCEKVENIAYWDFGAAEKLPEDRQLCPLCKRNILIRGAIKCDTKRFMWYRRFFDKGRVSNKLIERFLNPENVKIHMESPDEMELKYNDDTWMIYMDKDGVCTLHHNNYVRINETERYITSGFHRQKYHPPYLPGILAYIERHDWQRHLIPREEEITEEILPETTEVQAEMPQEKKNGIWIKSLWKWIQKEAVLSAAIFLALISAFLVKPDREYLHYIDWNTIFLLFSLMCVVAGMQELSVFRAIGIFLLDKVKGVRQLETVLVALPFFFSMLITNDVALITFVPFAILVLRIAEEEKQTIRIVVLQTLAANLGSMLTPIGNPQNLYLYLQSGMKLSDFLAATAPFVLASGALLGLCLCFGGKKGKKDSLRTDEMPRIDKRKFLVYLVLFLLCLLTVAQILPSILLFLSVTAVLLLVNRSSFRKVDYSLLATFGAFFLFIGNMERLPVFRQLIERLLTGHVRLFSVALSQIISNVPAAVLLSGFTNEWKELLIGVNLGGLGTLIASMASLISYKQIAAEYPEWKGKYFRLFTLLNVGMLVVLYGIGLVF